MKVLFRIFITPLILIIFCGTVFSQTDFKKIKNRVVDELMEPRVDDNRIEKLLQSINEDGTWPDINYEDVSRTGFEHRFHTENMLTLARAFQNKSSNYYQNEAVLKTIEGALKNWVDHDYFCENWWHNQIGTPNNLVSLILIIGEKLPKELVEKAQPIIGRANIDAPGARPGGDRIKISGIEAKNMLYCENAQKFDEIVKVIEGEIKFVDWVGADYGFGFRKIESGFNNRAAGGRGIQYDNSFHHRTDGVNNTLSYGLSYADAFVEWAWYTRDTRYAFSEEKLEQLIDYYLDGICKTAVFGKYPDAGAKNRSISRRGALRAYNSNTADKLLLTSNYRKNELQEIVDIRNNRIKPTLSHATFYWNSEHFTFQRPGFFTSVRIYSTRNYNMEVPYNSEGLLNHYRGDGTNHISRTGTEYDNIAPVFDYQKIPGATIMQQPEMPSENDVQKLGLTDFAGAVTDGKYAAVAFDFQSPHDPLIARKSWFFFDEEYVCLGAGISCNTDFSVVTTLNQCLLRDEVAVFGDNREWKVEKGEKQIRNVDWVYQDGIGYVFPKPTTINLKNNEASGSWWRINKQTDSPKEEVKRDVFKLWIDHGRRASDCNYEYIIVPATMIENLQSGNSKNNISILSNTPKIQAVENIGLEMYQIVFYQAGELQLNEKVRLTSDSPGIVLLKLSGQKISEISVADPNRELNKIHLSVSAKIEKQGDNFTSVWKDKKQISEVSIDLPTGGYAGKSVTIKLD